MESFPNHCYYYSGITNQASFVYLLALVFLHLIKMLTSCLYNYLFCISFKLNIINKHVCIIKGWWHFVFAVASELYLVTQAGALAYKCIALLGGNIEFCFCMNGFWEIIVSHNVCTMWLIAACMHYRNFSWDTVDFHNQKRIFTFI